MPGGNRDSSDNIDDVDYGAAPLWLEASPSLVKLTASAGTRAEVRHKGDCFTPEAEIYQSRRD